MAIEIVSFPMNCMVIFPEAIHKVGVSGAFCVSSSLWKAAYFAPMELTTKRPICDPTTRPVVNCTDEFFFEDHLEYPLVNVYIAVENLHFGVAN